MEILRIPNREHEAKAAAASRWRRIVQGKPPACAVLVAWRSAQAQRRYKATCNVP